MTNEEKYFRYLRIIGNDYKITISGYMKSVSPKIILLSPRGEIPVDVISYRRSGENLLTTILTVQGRPEDIDDLVVMDETFGVA